MFSIFKDFKWTLDNGKGYLKVKKLINYKSQTEKSVHN